ncbi:hypothetical protein [Arcobacter roscoffensis]|uniref:Uncharacterized protein n=1 Tax=Arcobacter roscoffensis TaxID=2961520 RepID=A0ABY5DZR0_9BACT|nr:hypothetical protein [Arcobacter roscoffensis]UTJ05444.1 hypothetical protein NJU99_09205 [Arcobacter roscoffensis]|tara:strand:+ start:200 stop:553 length:354 start_codon:yes stop_codon:yes gene_type:complete
MHEKQQRIRYIRVLEKFFTRTVSLLKLENFDVELFKQRTKKNYEDLKKVEAVPLHSSYLTSLTEFLNTTLQYIENHTEDFDDEKSTLLKQANLIQKEKKKKTYTKDKHRKHKFNDGY